MSLPSGVEACSGSYNFVSSGCRDTDNIQLSGRSNESVSKVSAVRRISNRTSWYKFLQSVYRYTDYGELIGHSNESIK